LPCCPEVSEAATKQKRVIPGGDPESRKEEGPSGCRIKACPRPDPGAGMAGCQAHETRDTRKGWILSEKCTNIRELAGLLMETLKRILRMIKFEHTLFALPLAYAGAMVGANGWPGWRKSLFILLAMVGARSAAMSFNRLADHPFDAKNPRTRNREIPSGQIRRGAVWGFLWCSVALFSLSALALGRWCFYLSPLALVVVLGYSYTKRFTWACHVFLGLALSLSPVGGFLAVTGTVGWPVVILSLGVLFWVGGFDIIYACQDVSFDREMGLHSIPAVVGQGLALVVSSLFHVVSFLLFVAAGWMGGLSWPYFAGTAAVGVLLIWEHRVVSGGQLERIDLAFFTINSYVSIVLLAGVIASTTLV